MDGRQTGLRGVSSALAGQVSVPVGSLLMSAQVLPSALSQKASWCIRPCYSEKKKNHCFITFRSNLLTVKSNVPKHTLTKHKVKEIEPKMVQDFLWVIHNVIIQMTTITVENSKIHCWSRQYSQLDVFNVVLILMSSVIRHKSLQILKGHTHPIFWKVSKKKKVSYHHIPPFTLHWSSWIICMKYPKNKSIYTLETSLFISQKGWWPTSGWMYISKRLNIGHQIDNATHWQSLFKCLIKSMLKW